MRYKFLFDVFKTSKEYKLFKSDKNTEEVQIDIYNKMLNIKTELESIYGRRLPIIDRFIDGIYLSKILSNTDLNKVYKTLSKFMKNCSIEDFRILYLFRLKLYNTIFAKEGPYVYCHLLPYVSLSVICGGILYLPLNLGDKKITLGKELDELTKPEHFFESRLIDANSKVFGCFEEVSKKKKADVAKHLLKSSCTCINVYLDRLLSVYNSLYLGDVSKNTKDFVDLKLFKLYIEDADDDLGFALLKCKPDYMSSDLIRLRLISGVDNPTEFKFSSLIASCDFRGLRDRKYILPNKGVILKCAELPNESSLVLEGYDELLGYYICQLVDEGTNKYFNMFLLKSDTANAYIPSASLLCLYNLYKIDSPKSDSTEVIFNDTTEGFRIYDMSTVFNAAYNAFIEGFSVCDIGAIPDQTCSEHKSDYEEIKCVNCICENVTLEVLQPSYWKYRDKEPSGHNLVRPSSDLFAEKMISIGAFKRKLPDGSQRGEQVEQLAEKYCINLKEGETIVSPFERRQKVKL